MNISINTYREIKLNSFHPLCKNVLGQRAIETYNFPAFIDGSYRREPDFQNTYPSITALCRQGIFAPHLRKDDIVVYITVQGNYSPYEEVHHRLIAILQVQKVFDSNEQAQKEYSRFNLPLPSNCMVPNNPPFSFHQTAGDFKTAKELKKYLSRDEDLQQMIGKRRVEVWNKEYLDKSRSWRCFIKTKPLYLNIEKPIPIYKRDFIKIFGKLPNTQTPKKISEKHLVELAKLANIEIILGKCIK